MSDSLQVRAQAMNEVRVRWRSKRRTEDALQLSRPRAPMAKQVAMADLLCEQRETGEKPHS